MKKTALLMTSLTLLAGVLYGTSPSTQSSEQQSYSQEEQNPYGEINTKGLLAIINSNVPVVILDTRASIYDDGKRIPGAKLLPYNSTSEQMTQAIPSKQSLIITYCTSAHCPLSKIEAEKLIQLGYNNVIKYPAGIEGWISEGNRYEMTPQK